MISVPVILTFALALFLTLLFPIMLILILAWKKKISLLPLGFGFLSFLLSQVLTRIPLLQAFSTQEWYQNFAVLHPVVLGLLLAFTAGLFEETARLGGSALLGPRKPAFPGGPARPGYRTFEGALSFGLGHAFCEVILLAGLTHINNRIFCFLVSSGSSQLLAQLLPAGQLELVTAQLSAVRVPDILAGLLERLSAVLFHLFATSLVFLAAARRKWILYPAAILAHTVFNCVALLPLGIWPIELLLFALALLCGFLFRKSRSWFPNAETGGAGTS